MHGAEGAVELGDGLEPGFVGDVGDAPIGLAEQFGGVFKAKAGDVLVVGKAGGVVKDPGEMFGADLAGGGGLGEADFPGEGMGADVATGAGDDGRQRFQMGVPCSARRWAKFSAARASIRRTARVFSGPAEGDCR